MTEVCKDVCIEPVLLPLTEEVLEGRTAFVMMVLGLILQPIDSGAEVMRDHFLMLYIQLVLPPIPANH